MKKHDFSRLAAALNGIGLSLGIALAASGVSEAQQARPAAAASTKPKSVAAKPAVQKPAAQKPTAKPVAAKPKPQPPAAPNPMLDAPIGAAAPSAIKPPAIRPPAAVAKRAAGPRSLELVLPFPQAFVKRIPVRNKGLFDDSQPAVSSEKKVCDVNGAFVWSRSAKEFLKAFSNLGGKYATVHLTLLTQCDPTEAKGYLDALLAPETTDSLKIALVGVGEPKPRPEPSASAAPAPSPSPSRRYPRHSPTPSASPAVSPSPTPSPTMKPIDLAKTVGAKIENIARFDYPAGLWPDYVPYAFVKDAAIKFDAAYYEFPSYPYMETEREAAKPKKGWDDVSKFFAPTEDEWEAENGRLGGIWLMVREFVEQELAKPAFVDSLRLKAASEPLQNFSREGTIRLAGAWKATFVRPQFTDDVKGLKRLNGCSVLNTRTHAEVRKLDAVACAADRKTAYVWILDRLGRRCQMIDFDTRALIGPEALASNCSAQSDSIVLDPESDLNYPVAASDMKPEFCTNAAVALEGLGLRGEKFRDMILSGKSLGNASCDASLKAYYQSGGTFRADEILPHIVELRNLRADLRSRGYNDALVSGDYDFFHYTSDDLGKYVNGGMADRTDAYNKTRREKGFEKIFEFVKPRAANRCCQTGVNRGFYVAADPLSSKSYGTNQLKLTLAPNTKVVVGATTDSLGSNGTYSSPFYSALDTATARLSPRAAGCGVDLVQLLILEESGVQLVLSNFGYESQGKGPWFFLLNSGPIRQACFR